MTSREVRAAATREALLDVGLDLFGADGFAAVTGGRVVTAAGLTRGALYHHFDGLDGLFAAVYERLMEGLADELRAVLADSATAHDGLVAAVSRFLDHLAEPAFRQVVVLDAPTVFGWADWRAREVERCLGLFRGPLAEALAAKGLDDDPADVAQLYFGAVVEGALMVAHADDPAGRRRSVEATLLKMSLGLAGG